MEDKLEKMFEKSIIRLEILLGRARGCDDGVPDDQKRHGVTEIEVPGWIQEEREFLEEYRKHKYGRKQ